MPRRRLLLVLLTLLVVVTAAGSAALAVAGGRDLPPRVTIAGVDVGNASREDARRLVEARADALLARPLRVGGVVTTGAALGGRPRTEEALDQAENTDVLDRLVARLGGGGHEVALAFDFDRSRLAFLARRLRTSPPIDARLLVDKAGARVVPAQPGRGVTAAALGDALRFLPADVEPPASALAADVSTAEAVRARELVERLTDSARTVALRDVAVRLEPATLLGLIVVDSRDGRLSVAYDADGLAAVLGSAFAEYETEPRDAGLRVVGRRIEIDPGSPGRRLDAAAIAASLAGNASSRVHRARFRDVAPDVTAADIERLGVRDVVSEFTSAYPAGEARVTNIKRAAELLDGTLIPAGGTFSMNGALGRRTTANGFVPAPQIGGGGRLGDSVGGGISQVATTLYNAAFFAGLELVSHTPHSFWIDRYPKGREATVSWGGPELIFRNDWSAAVYVDLEATDTSITARFFSSRLGRRVETRTETPSAYVEPRVLTVTNPALPRGVRSVVQEAGSPGFTVEYTRRVYEGGRLRRDERFRVRYEPKNAIVEVGSG